MPVLYLGGEHHILQAQLGWSEGKEPTLTIEAKHSVGAMPSFLHFCRNSSTVLAVSEEDEFLLSFSRDVDGGLSLKSRVPCKGGPAYVSASQDEGWALTASYGSGETRSYPLATDGTLREESSCAATGQYSHSCVSAPKRAWVAAPSKGTDSIPLLKLEPSSGELSEMARVKTPDGSGPRHIVFSRDGRRAYVACENDCSLLIYDVTDSGLTQIQALSTLPDAQKEGDTGSDLHLSSDDRFLYVSNRGHDSLAVFEITDSGAQLLGHESTRGAVPRNFCLLDDRRIIVANQESSSLSFFVRDVQKGTLDFVASISLDERPFWVGNEDSR